ncbi:MAG: hypothetical protein HYY37_01375 [Candidatus Aenigmarchaeota archaeon]|nr:hypothetical protein [Candidatus Aenigmarchaeota archaeon]
MLVIVDNGNGQELASMVRMQHVVAKPDKIPDKASAFILSDGSLSNQKANEKIIGKTDKPVLGVGAGCLFIGTAFGASVKSVPKVEKQEKIMLKKPCPLTVDMKKALLVFEKYQNVFDELPENLGIVASSPKYEYEIIQEMEKPFFGVHFLPEKGGDGRTVLANFERFVEIWGKYHR